MGKGAKIVIAGEGGQGIQSVANMITEAAYQEGREALYIPNFGVEQRGGVSVAYVQISDEPIGSPKFKTADIAIALSKRAVFRIAKYCDANTLFIYEGDIDVAEDELPQVKRILAVPAIRISQEEFNPRVFNVLIMGVVIGMSHVVGVETVKGTIETKLGYKFEKQPELREMNYAALDRGIKLVAEHAAAEHLAAEHTAADATAAEQTAAEQTAAEHTAAEQTATQATAAEHTASDRAAEYAAE